MDDGSHDDTGERVARFSERDCRIKLYSHERSRGPSEARNTALRHVSGSWVILLDADDTLGSTRIASLVNEAENRGLDLLADNLMLVDAATGSALQPGLDPELMSGSETLSLLRLLHADWPGRNTKFRSLGVAKPIMRRSFLDATRLRYDPEVRLGEDLLLYSCLLAAGARFGVTSACGYNYTINANTISRRRVPTMELVEVNERIRRCVEASSMPEREDVLALLSKRDAALRFQVLTWALKLGDLDFAIRLAASLPISTIVALVGEKLMKWLPIGDRARMPPLPSAMQP